MAFWPDLNSVLSLRQIYLYWADCSCNAFRVSANLISQLSVMLFTPNTLKIEKSEAYLTVPL